MAQGSRYRSVSGDVLYRRMATGEPIVLLDVRTRTEFAKQHIPGSVLIPLQNLEARLAEVPRNGVPLAVVCEEGVRSGCACRLLAEHGFRRLLNLEDGLEGWPGPVSSGLGGNGSHPMGIAPSSFLVESFHMLPKALALDLAMGEGRNAIYLASRGFDVDGVEADPEAVARSRVAARRLGAPIRAIVGNVEDGTYIIPIETYDVILVFNYLHRPLFTDIRDGVVPGGVAIYQGFTEEQARHGEPQDPERLLRPNELREAFAAWEVLHYREFTGPSRGRGPARALARIVARKPKRGR